MWSNATRMVHRLRNRFFLNGGKIKARWSTEQEEKGGHAWTCGTNGVMSVFIGTQHVPMSTFYDIIHIERHLKQEGLPPPPWSFSIDKETKGIRFTTIVNWDRIHFSTPKPPGGWPGIQMVTENVHWNVQHQLGPADNDKVEIAWNSIQFMRPNGGGNSARFRDRDRNWDLGINAPWHCIQWHRYFRLRHRRSFKLSRLCCSRDQMECLAVSGCRVGHP